MSARNVKFVGTIPALPGFYVLEALDDDNGYPSDVCKNPVVAWALEEEVLAPHPITLEGVQTGNVYILQPDGAVERPYIDWFPSVDEWLKYQQGEYTEKKGRKA